MLVYKEYENFINGHDDLVELNIIQLINTTLKGINKEVVYSEDEKRFYLYKDKFWQPSDLSVVVSIFWTEYQTNIFPLIANNKKKKVIEYTKALEEKADNAKELLRVVKRFEFFVQLSNKKVKEYIESISNCCPRIPKIKYDKIPLQNGYIDMNDFSFNRINPYIYNRYVLQFNYLDNAKKPEMFLKFLNQILPDEETRDFLINWLAYLLVEGNYRQKALFLFGSGQNGKGVLSRIIQRLVGTDNYTSLTVNQLSSTKNYYLSQLNNKLVNICPDSGDSDKIELDTFKILTGDDTVEVRPIYGKPFPLKYKGKLIYSVNKIPYFTAKDDAVMRRPEILNFPVTIKKEDRIPFLDEKILEKEGDLIFSFLLEKIKILKSINFDFEVPASVRDFTYRVIEEQDNLSIFMLNYLSDEETKQDEVVVLWFIPLRKFYTKYKEYMLEGGFNVLNEKNFKDNVINWAKRRNDIKINYKNNGKNMGFEFQRNIATEKLDINSDSTLVDENGNELF